MLALGGGSTIDTAKRVSAETGLPLVSVPTTYSGAEWTNYFGVRDSRPRMRGGGGGAHNEAIVYDVDLTLGLPRERVRRHRAQRARALRARRSTWRAAIPRRIPSRSKLRD